MRDQGVDGSGDTAVARIAARQHGVVTVTQLRAAGLLRDAIARRVDAGRLHRIYRGVYAVGHAGLGNEGRWTAAVLACGNGAALSHRSAAELWRLLKPTDGPVHVTAPVAGGRTQRPGLTIHRSSHLTSADTTRRDGIAVTTPERTVGDLKRVCPRAVVRRALRQAEFLGLPVGRYEAASEMTRSELERMFLRLCRRHRLPSPEVNVRVGRFTVDFLWRQEGLVVETDGYAAHRGQQAFEDDRRRDGELATVGMEVLRFTYGQVRNEADQVARVLRSRLDARRLTL